MKAFRQELYERLRTIADTSRVDAAFGIIVRVVRESLADGRITSGDYPAILDAATEVFDGIVAGDNPRIPNWLELPAERIMRAAIPYAIKMSIDAWVDGHDPAAA